MKNPQYLSLSLQILNQLLGMHTPKFKTALALITYTNLKDGKIYIIMKKITISQSPLKFLATLICNLKGEVIIQSVVRFVYFQKQHLTVFLRYWLLSSKNTLYFLLWYQTCVNSPMVKSYVLELWSPINTLPVQAILSPEGWSVSKGRDFPYPYPICSNEDSCCSWQW